MNLQAYAEHYGDLYTFLFAGWNSPLYQHPMDDPDGIHYLPRGMVVLLPKIKGLIYPRPHLKGVQFLFLHEFIDLLLSGDLLALEVLADISQCNQDLTWVPIYLQLMSPHITAGIFPTIKEKLRELRDAKETLDPHGAEAITTVLTHSLRVQYLTEDAAQPINPQTDIRKNLYALAETLYGGALHEK